MRKLAILGAGLVLAACGEDGKKDSVAITDEPCRAEDEGFSRCSAEDVVQTCDGTYWREVEDCVASGLACASTGVGAARCVPDCPIFQPQGFGVAYDPEILSFARMVVVDDSGERELFIENWPSYPGAIQPASSGTVDIAAGHATRATCGVCLYLVEYAPASRIWFADEGSVTLTMPAATGSELAVVATGLHFYEVDAQFDPVPDGSCYRLDSLSAGPAEAGPWTCRVAENAAGQSPPDGGTYCAHNDLAGQYDIWTCTGDCATGDCEIHKTADCDSASRTCDPADNATFTAECQ